MRTAQCTMLLKRIKRLLLLLLLAVLGCADVIKVCSRAYYARLVQLSWVYIARHLNVPTHPCDTPPPQLAPCTNSMLVGMYRDPNVTFASTMLRGGQPPPQLVFADRQRESDALNALLANADPTAINGSFPPITMFISDNTGFVRSLSGTLWGGRCCDMCRVVGTWSTICVAAYCDYTMQHSLKTECTHTHTHHTHTSHTHITHTHHTHHIRPKMPNAPTPLCKTSSSNSLVHGTFPLPCTTSSRKAHFPLNSCCLLSVYRQPWA